MLKIMSVCVSEIKLATQSSIHLCNFKTAKPIKRNSLVLGPEMTHFSPEQVFKSRFISPFNNRFYNGNANAVLAISVLADVTVSSLVERKSVLFHI